MGKRAGKATRLTVIPAKSPKDPLHHTPPIAKTTLISNAAALTRSASSVMIPQLSQPQHVKESHTFSPSAYIRHKGDTMRGDSSFDRLHTSADIRRPAKTNPSKRKKDDSQQRSDTIFEQSGSGIGRYHKGVQGTQMPQAQGGKRSAEGQFSHTTANTTTCMAQMPCKTAMDMTDADPVTFDFMSVYRPNTVQEPRDVMSMLLNEGDYNSKNMNNWEEYHTGTSQNTKALTVHAGRSAIATSAQISIAGNKTPKITPRKRGRVSSKTQRKDSSIDTGKLMVYSESYSSGGSTVTSLTEESISAFVERTAQDSGSMKTELSEHTAIDRGEETNTDVNSDTTFPSVTDMTVMNEAEGMNEPKPSTKLQDVDYLKQGKVAKMHSCKERNDPEWNLASQSTHASDDVSYTSMESMHAAHSYTSLEEGTHIDIKAERDCTLYRKAGDVNILTDYINPPLRIKEEKAVQPKVARGRPKKHCRVKETEERPKLGKPSKRGLSAPVKKDALFQKLTQLKLYRLHTPIPHKVLRTKGNCQVEPAEIIMVGSLNDYEYDPECCDHELSESLELRGHLGEPSTSFLWKTHLSYDDQLSPCWCFCCYDFFGSFVQKRFSVDMFGFDLALELANRCRENAEAMFHMLWIQQKRDSLDCSIPNNITSAVVGRLVQLNHILLHIDRCNPLTLQTAELVKSNSA
ncbi:hypothetical protein BgAZ_205720 [Babesia gibsoni]|uniref:Uncharacterized protein n=1 Tax=Babesia gibsoni TaxID=33632 RepID=A0AAD8LRJ7_BABGI|nr:hypothetical protein BgAZ_205720 [Babesia gibsoni]